MRLVVRVKTGASRSAVGGSHGAPPSLVVAVHAQPVDGKANEAVINALADSLGVKARHISIVSGQTSRTKHLEIIAPDVDDAALTSRVTALMSQQMPRRQTPLTTD